MPTHPSILKNTAIGALTSCVVAMTTIGIGQAVPPSPTPSPVPTASPKTVPTTPSTMPKKMAPGKVSNHCKSTESLFLSMETKTYHISICGGDKPYDMVLFKKADRKMERLTLEKADRNMFEAKMNDNAYTLAKTNKGSVFTITKITYTETFREPITKGW